MSQSLVGGSSFASRSKATCPECRRTVVKVKGADGRSSIATDTELIAVVVVVQDRAERVLARRVHGDTCGKYRLADEHARQIEQQKLEERAAKRQAEAEASKAAAWRAVERERAREAELAAKRKAALVAARGLDAALAAADAQANRRPAARRRSKAT